MGRDVQPLPIGIIVPGGFGLQILGLPIRQHLAQGTFTVGPAAFAVQRLCPVFQHPARLVVERADQRGFPIIPGVRSDPANVTDGQHGQQVQPPDGSHRLGEILYRARVCDIALLRHVGHQKVIAHQPFDCFAFPLCHAQPWGDLARNFGAQNRMILRPSLADVVQQHRHHQGLAIDALVDDFRADRQLVFQLVPLDLREIRDHLNRVLVHRIRMVHVELHHRHDGLKFRDESGQHAQLVHPAQRAFGVAVFQQQIKENADGFLVFADLVVDQVQIVRDQTHGMRVDQHARAQAFLEDAQEIQLVG